jgi:subtilisin family serine protease
MKKAMSLCGLILFLMLILSLLTGVASAEPIIIDTEKGVPRFRTEPARDLPANWQYVHDHPDTSADGWFDTYAYPPGQGNGSFWYTISFPDMGECKGIWETSVPYTGKYEVFAWIPSPDSFDPYLDESTPPSDYLPTKRAQYKVFHNDGVATVTIDQNDGGFTSLGVFEFDSTARVVLSSNGVEFWRCVAFDAVKFVPVVHDMAVTDVFIMPPMTSVEQSTAICVTVTNEGSQQEENVSVKAFVDGFQLGSTKYVSLDPGASDTRTFLWIPSAAKKYSVEGEVEVVSGETDTGDSTKAIEVGVPAMPAALTVNESGTYTGTSIIVLPNGTIQTTIDIEEPEFVPGELIVKFKPYVSVNASISTKGIATIGYCSIDTLNEQYGVTSLEKVFETAERPVTEEISDLSNIYIFELPKDADILSIAEVYQKDPNVEYAEPNYIAQICVTPNDPYYSQQWAHQNMQSEQAWDIETGDPGVAIAIIDTGVDWGHPDLAANIWNNTDEIPGNGIDDDNNGYIDDVRGWDFVNSDGDPIDDNGHGTHCSGIAAAETDNGVGVAGVCWNCAIMPLKGLNMYGSGGSSDLAIGIQYAADNDANVISMSWGSYGYSNLIKDVMDYAYVQGVVLVGAAGNDNTISKFYPASYDNVIAVSATDSNEDKASFSNYGSWIDVAAPGVSIYSTMPTYQVYLNTQYGIPQNYADLSGTSMSCPFVAGLAGLILSKTNFSQEEVRTILRSTTDNISPNKYIGIGRINAYNAILRSSTPIANLNSSLDDATVGGTINITGIAKGSTFMNYSVCHGEGVYPSNWTAISNSSSQVNDSVLASWDTNRVNDGTYTIRLVIYDMTGLISEDRTVLTVDNAYLLYPLNNDIFRAGDTIAINGTIFGDIQNYTIEYGFGYSPTEWFTNGINLTNNGQEPIANGTLATWNTSSITEADFYTIRLTANYIGKQNYAFIRTVYLDPNLKEGWPKRIDYYFHEDSPFPTFFTTSDFCTIGLTVNHTNEQNESIITIRKDELFQIYNSIYESYYYWGGNLEPVVSDIDGDGYDEIIIYKGGEPPRIFVYRQDGSPYWSADVGTTGVAGGNLHIPLVGDINNDGFDEIIAYNFKRDDGYNSELFAFKYDGSILGGWPVLVPKDYHPTMLMADLNLDGTKEIVIKGNDARNETMVIVNNAGGIVSQWYLPNVGWGASIASTPAIGNFDDDPELEIVAASPAEGAGGIWEDGNFIGWNNTGVIHVYNMDGSDVDGWPVYTEGIIFSSPAVGDIDDNGELEIVVGLMFAGSAPNYSYGGVYAFDKNGNVLPGWPFEKGWNFWSSPSLADFDGDGDLEIATSRLGFITYVIHHNGTIAFGWPQYTTWNDYYSTIVGDVNNDNAPDVITTAGNGFYPSIYDHGGVYAWNFNGTLIEGFPKVTEVDVQAPAVIADIDSDGEVELIASSNWDRDLETKMSKHRGSLYVWEIDSDYHQETMEWPTFHHDTWLTGLYGLVPVGPPPKITAFAPESPVNDTLCNWRTFNVTVNQTVDVRCYLNGTLQATNVSVTEANCTLHAKIIGEHNVSFVATNENGTDMQTWIWNVTKAVGNPDLVITGKWLCWPDNCTICYNVTNIGDGTAPACHNTALYVNDVAVAQDHVPVALAPGESYTGCFNGYEWGYTPPSDGIRVCADNSETLDELHEDNNCLTNIWMCGDVNGDGKVTMSDVRKVFNRYLDPNYPLDLPWAADVNGDGKVTMSDVRKVFNCYLDPGYDLNCCCEGEE